MSISYTHGTNKNKEQHMTLPTGVEYYTVAEVASHLRISKMSVYRYVKSGKIASVRLGGSVRIPTGEVARLEADNTASVQVTHTTELTVHEEEATEAYDSQRPAEEL